MKRLLLLTIFLSAALFLPVTPATAKSKPKKPAAPAVSTSDRISAVHLTSITVSIYSPASSKEYKVTSATKITVNGQPGTLSSLATGMDVSVTTTTDPTAAATIDAKSPKK